ncbi:MAG: DUF4190 domain-containing protein [Lachnospiraceae bacterium]|nr:DUF4190 domain-containing protein [Lachnospiraceae bacterium]MBQ7832945.1 DUF4190 domain-containing protein [Lachnospiraceae bacterium]
MDGNNMNNEYTYAADSVYDAAPAPAGNGLAIAALICGIAGIICCPCGIVSVVAIILGAMGKKKCANTGMAQWGLILGIVGVVLFVIAVIVFAILIAAGLISGM